MLDHGMRPQSGRILVAVSGGADSTALLLLLHRLAATMRLELHIAHFDHSLRGRDVTRREEAFVRSLCEMLTLPLTTGKADVRETASRAHLSLEDAARRERYVFFAQVAYETGCNAVATGHTASDQAETVLMHLIRGAGLKGLSGIAPVSAWPFPGHSDFSLIRPILTLTRDDTRAVCAAFGIKPIDDESNASPEFRRNRIRHEVMPLLRELNPRIDDALVRVAEAASEDVGFVETKARELLDARAILSTREKTGAEVRLPRSLSEEHASVRKAALRLALESLAGDRQEFTQRHYDAVQKLWAAGVTGDRAVLPRNVVAILTKDDILLTRTHGPRPSPLPEGEGIVLCSLGACLRFGSLAAKVLEERPKTGTWVAVDAGAVEAGVRMRRRRDGDRFQPLGMKGTKKLQDFFVDARVPRSERDSVPIFDSERGIVWVGGLRIADWAKPQAGAPTLFLWYGPVTD
jgi:tRNA(Ile)-lysidine synthetase-like protein